VLEQMRRKPNGQAPDLDGVAEMARKRREHAAVHADQWTHHMTSAAARWKRRPEGSNWGDFGPDDQLGRLNLLTDAVILQAAGEIIEGRSFTLSLPLDYPGGNLLTAKRHPPVLKPTAEPDGRLNLNHALCDEDPALTDVINDDLAILHLQYSTHWDSLAHVGALFDADGDGIPEMVFYNGYRAGEHIVDPSGGRGGDDVSTMAALALGVEKMAEHGVQGRGIMIDLHARYGRSRVLVGYDDLMRIMDADGVVIGPADMICLHTGYAQVLLDLDKRPDERSLHHSCAVLDGRDRKLLQWITDSQISALIADNYAVESVPYDDRLGCSAVLPLHEHCLFKLGLNLGELWHLTPLANWLREHKRNRFFLTAPPLRLTGAVGAPLTPTGTV
jgi:Putative cyclase